MQPLYLGRLRGGGSWGEANDKEALIKHTLFKNKGMNGIAVLIFFAAYSEVVRVASNVEDNVSGTEVQQVHDIASLQAALNWVLGFVWVDFFGENYLHILVDPK